MLVEKSFGHWDRYLRVAGRRRAPDSKHSGHRAADESHQAGIEQLMALLRSSAALLNIVCVLSLEPKAVWEACSEFDVFGSDPDRQAGAW
jgi:hypothetical protein